MTLFGIGTRLFSSSKSVPCVMKSSFVLRIVSCFQVVFQYSRFQYSWRFTIVDWSTHYPGGLRNRVPTRDGSLVIHIGLGTLFLYLTDGIRHHNQFSLSSSQDSFSLTDGRLVSPLLRHYIRIISFQRSVFPWNRLCYFSTVRCSYHFLGTWISTQWYFRLVSRLHKVLSRSPISKFNTCGP